MLKKLGFRQLLEETLYRVFVTSMKVAIEVLVWFYNQQASARRIAIIFSWRFLFLAAKIWRHGGRVGVS